jgi:hypothetical protein
MTPLTKGSNMGGTIGNKNSSKENRVWGKVVRKLAVQEDAKRIHKVAEALFRKAEEGDISAIKELGDRIDGKAMQEITGNSDAPITVIVKTGIDEE